MNTQLRRHDLVGSTRAAEGLPRRRWTTAELLRMTEAGILDPAERFELIGGELVPMSPKGRRHEVVCDQLTFVLGKLATDEVRVSVERQFDLDDDTYTDPDFLIRPAAILVPDVRGATALLVIEVADTSLDYDLGTKARLYARNGVREYWVIEAWSLRTTIHREPAEDGYHSVVKATRAKRLVPTLVPALSLRLKDIGV